jgi:predicted component of type VI protein secretion system
VHTRLADRVRTTIAAVRGLVCSRDERWVLLALDWTGGQESLLLGRHAECDVVLSDPSVSRRHARLFFRDGSWFLQDLGSTNGTVINGVSIGRCELRPGDRLIIGNERLEID